MFEKETVLILGAGASCHYGYPTGEELINEIISSIKTSSWDGKQLFREPHFGRLCESLEFYDPLSIDNFLSQSFSDKNLVSVGKIMIANQILEHEDIALFKRKSPDSDKGKDKEKQNWYRFLAHALTEKSKPEYLLENELPLHIITFNYDLSLEYYLYSRFHETPFFNGKGISFVQKLYENIAHMYGSVGKFQLEGHDPHLRQCGDYGSLKPISRWEKARQYKDNIFVINEDRENNINADEAKAIKWLEKAENIFILGFGFNQDNINLLQLGASCAKAKNVYCTNFEDSEIINKKIQSLFSHRMQKVPPETAPIAVSRNLVISNKKVYGSLEKDFTLVD